MIRDERCADALRLASRIMAGDDTLDGRPVAATLVRHYHRVCPCYEAPPEPTDEQAP